MKKSYPFVTKAQLKVRLQDFAFCCEAMVILFDRQTAFEQDTSQTLNRNRRGFMSSHAVHGTRIAKAIRAGATVETMSNDDIRRVFEISSRYTKQLADHFRGEALEARPELAEMASVYGV